MLLALLFIKIGLPVELLPFEKGNGFGFCVYEHGRPEAFNNNTCLLCRAPDTFPKPVINRINDFEGTQTVLRQLINQFPDVRHTLIGINVHDLLPLTDKVILVKLHGSPVKSQFLFMERVLAEKQTLLHQVEFITVVTEKDVLK